MSKKVPPILPELTAHLAEMAFHLVYSHFVGTHCPKPVVAASTLRASAERKETYNLRWKKGWSAFTADMARLIGDVKYPGECKTPNIRYGLAMQIGVYIRDNSRYFVEAAEREKRRSSKKKGRSHV